MPGLFSFKSCYYVLLNILLTIGMRCEDTFNQAAYATDRKYSTVSLRP